MTEYHHPIVEITKSRMREFYREPGALFWVFVFPVLMAVVLGIAFDQKPAAVPAAALVDKSNPPWVAKTLEGHPVDVQPLSETDAELALKKGSVDLIIKSNSTSKVTYIYDNNRAESRLARHEINHILQESMGQSPVVKSDDLSPTLRGSRYIDYVIPGLIGLNVMGGSMWGIGYALVLARRRKVLRRLAATPMRRSHFLLGYLLFRFIFLTWEVSALLLFAFLAFSVVVQGAFTAVAVLSVLGAFAFSGLGLLVAARIESLEAANGWLNFLMLPSWLLSGTFFSYLRFPEFMHLPIQLLPLTALNDAMRSVFNEGASIGGVIPQMAVLTVWGAVCFTLALKTFKWQ
jgi:ABC-2 type transport system permease protein